MSQQADLPRQADVIGVEHTRASFEEYVTATSDRLFTMALLLTGYNRAEAEDLLQTVLERAYRRWWRISRSGDDPGPYVRKMLVNASVDRWRLLRRRPEEPLAAAGAVPAAGDEAALLADRDQLLRAMAALPAGQRAVLVLRYFEDLSEAQVAAALGCSVGSVKSQSARALARLRTVVAAPGEPDAATTVPMAGARKAGGVMDDLERRLREALRTAAEPSPPGLLAAVRRRRARHLRRVGGGCAAAVAVLAVAITPAARALRTGTGPAPAVGGAHHAAHGAHGPTRLAPATRPVAGTALVDCRSERNGPLSPTWQAQSVRVGPVWFVFAGIKGPWTASLPLGGGYVPPVSAGQPTRAISVIIAVRNGSTVVVSAAPAARQHLRFLTVPGQDVTTFSLRYGHPGLTLAGCPASPVGTGIPESYAAGLTVYWVPYITDRPRCVPLVIRELPGGRPIPFTLSRSGGTCPAG